MEQNNNNIPVENKKRKTTNSKVPDVPIEWTRCHAYLKGKSRFCRQQIVNGQGYCGNHMNDHVLVEQSIKQPNDSGGTNAIDETKSSAPTTIWRKRIPCPVDPTHTIFEDNVIQHIPKCPKTIAQREQESQVFYHKDINTGGRGIIRNEEWDVKYDSIRSNLLDHSKKLAMRVLHVHQKLFARTNCEISNDLSQITYSEIEDCMELVDKSQCELNAGLLDDIQFYRIKSGGHRHLNQQASLVGILRDIGVLDNNVSIPSNINETTNVAVPKSETTILEMGAGRGMTGLILAGAMAAALNKNDDNNLVDKSNNSINQSVRLIMIERAASRSRADKVLRNILKPKKQSMDKQESVTGKYLDLEHVEWKRIQCDLAHIDIQNILSLPQQCDFIESNEILSPNTINQTCTSEGPVPSRNLIVVAKHCCGVGTDFALKSLEPVKDQLSACIMATCCHGVCGWEDFVGRDYLREVMVCQNSNCTEIDDTREPVLLDFGPIEFELLRHWSSGSVKCACQYDGVKAKKMKIERDDDHGSCDVPVSSKLDSEGRNKVSVSKVADALNLQCGAQGLGRACQRLIDYGRLQYICKVLYSNVDDNSKKTQLLHYVPADITPQNALLLGYHRPSTL